MEQTSQGIMINNHNYYFFKIIRPAPLHFNQQDLIDSGKELCEMLLKMQHYFKSARYSCHSIKYIILFPFN